MARLPASLIRKYGVSKKAWAVFRSQRSTRKKVKTMSKRRRYRFPRWRFRRRRSPKKFSILTIAGCASGLVIPAATSGGGKSPVQAIMDGQWNWAAESVIENYSGYNIYTGQWSIWNARGLFAAVAGALASKGLSAVGANRAFSGLPAPLNRIKF